MSTIGPGMTYFLGGIVENENQGTRNFTPAQQDRLTTVREHDILVIVNADPEGNRLLYITDIHHYHPGVSPPRITVLDIPCYAPECFVHYMNGGEWYFQGHALRQRNKRYYDLRIFLNANSEIILRPTVEQLRVSIYPGTCGYGDCDDGLVRLSRRTAQWMEIYASRQRLQEPSWTLCPYCMGPHLSETHERLVHQRSSPRPVNEEMERIHMRAVNVRRDQHGYPPLSLDRFARLPHLTPGQPPAETPFEDVVFRQAETRRLLWYRNSKEHDELGQCIICTEDFNADDQDDSKMITELPCKHMYCQECIQRWTAQVVRSRGLESNCPLKCPGIGLV